MIEDTKSIYACAESIYRKTLKGSLSVLKLTPGTNFNQTGKPLEKKRVKNQTPKGKKKKVNLKSVNPFRIKLYKSSSNGKSTQNSTLHKCKAQCEDAHITQLSGSAWWTELNHISPQSYTKTQKSEKKNYKKRKERWNINKIMKENIGKTE